MFVGLCSLGGTRYSSGNVYAKILFLYRDHVCVLISRYMIGRLNKCCLQIGPQKVLITGLLPRRLYAPKGHWHIENGHQIRTIRDNERREALG